MEKTVCVLVVDTPMYDVNSPLFAQFGDFGNQAEALLKPYTSAKFKHFQVKANHELPTTKDLENCLGIYITGSRSDAFNNNEPWFVKLCAFLQPVLREAKIPVAGVCFGHQVVCSLLGAKVGRNDRGWEFGPFAIKKSPEFADYMARLGVAHASPDLTLVESHQDVVHELPQDCHNMGSTKVCAVQGVFNGRNLLTFQGHPEFTNPYLREVLAPAKYSKQAISKELFDDLVASDAQNNGSTVGELIIRFFESA